MRDQTRFRSILQGASFRTSEVQHHGLSPGALRSAALAAPYSGVRALGVDLDSVFGRCLAYEPLLTRAQVFCAETAALLLGLPLPLLHQQDERLHVGTRGGQGPRRAGVVGHRLAADVAVVDAVGGFTVTDAVSTWCQLAGTLSREELTAVGDRILSGQRLHGAARTEPLATLDQLRLAVKRHGSGRGAKALRWALQQVRPGVDSAPETLLRLLLIASGFAEPIIGLPVLVEGGTLTLHPDLAWPELRIALEYEGDGHRENLRRFRGDIRRKEMFEAAGWRVIRVTADDLGGERTSFIERVRAVRALRVAEFARIGGAQA